MTAEDGRDGDHVLHFEDGIPGFPDSHRFALVDLEDGGAFQLLQSLDEPDVSMIVCVPWLFFPDYTPELSDVEQRELGLERPEDAIVFCPVTLDAEQEAIYVNLLGPFVVHAESHEGRQVVLADADHPVRAEVRLD